MLRFSGFVNSIYKTRNCLDWFSSLVFGICEFNMQTSKLSRLFFIFGFCNFGLQIPKEVRLMFTICVSSLIFCIVFALHFSFQLPCPVTQPPWSGQPSRILRTPRTTNGMEDGPSALDVGCSTMLSTFASVWPTQQMTQTQKCFGANRVLSKPRLGL